MNREERCSFRNERTGPPDGGRPCLSVSRLTSRPPADRLSVANRLLCFCLYTNTRTRCVSFQHKNSSPFCPSALRSPPSNHSCRLPARRPSGRPSPPCYPHVVPSGFAAALRAVYTTGPSLTAVVLPIPGTFASHLRAHRAGDARSRHLVPVCPLRPVSRTLVPSSLRHRFAMPLALRARGALRAL